MRKKQQAIHISTNAKKNFCQEISLSNYTYEEEIKEQLNDYFNNNTKDEDVENDEENKSSDDDSFDICDIRVPKQDLNITKEFAKFQISEKAILSRIEDFNYELIPQKMIKISENENEKFEENNRDIGTEIKMDDIIKQYIFWKENCDEKDKKKCEIEPFELFNLDSEKIKEIKQKSTELKKIVKDKKMNDPTLNKLVKEIEDNYIEQRKELNNLVNNMEKVDIVSYGKNYSIVEYKK